jgi:hypothetical protein
MADPISLAAGLITLVTFGVKSSSSLYQTIKDFNSHQRNVRERRDEIEALSVVLASLHRAVRDTNTDFEDSEHCPVPAVTPHSTFCNYGSGSLELDANYAPIMSRSHSLGRLVWPYLGQHTRISLRSEQVPAHSLCKINIVTPIQTEWGEIQVTATCKYLGLKTDAKLHWKEHTEGYLVDDLFGYVTQQH